MVTIQKGPRKKAQAKTIRYAYRQIETRHSKGQSEGIIVVTPARKLPRRLRA